MAIPIQKWRNNYGEEAEVMTTTIERPRTDLPAKDSVIDLDRRNL